MTEAEVIDSIDTKELEKILKKITKFYMGKLMQTRHGRNLPPQKTAEIIRNKLIDALCEGVEKRMENEKTH